MGTWVCVAAGIGRKFGIRQGDQRIAEHRKRRIFRGPLIAHRDVHVVSGKTPVRSAGLASAGGEEALHDGVFLAGQLANAFAVQMIGLVLGENIGVVELKSFIL